MKREELVGPPVGQLGPKLTVGKRMIGSMKGWEEQVAGVGGSERSYWLLIG